MFPGQNELSRVEFEPILTGIVTHFATPAPSSTTLLFWGIIYNISVDNLEVRRTGYGFLHASTMCACECGVVGYLCDDENAVLWSWLSVTTFRIFVCALITLTQLCLLLLYIIQLSMFHVHVLCIDTTTAGVVMSFVRLLISIYIRASGLITTFLRTFMLSKCSLRAWTRFMLSPQLAYVRCVFHMSKSFTFWVQSQNFCFLSGALSFSLSCVCRVLGDWMWFRQQWREY